ncbi:fimbria/pilus outer membrane usher protein [Buttiauxella sp. A2-C1_F]|uniref:fimbria/pilus outer membrane usher protein n=1 Tax=Buttiauxella sp. A2-C1_F TaxID=2904526 RepID=UPI001E2B9390|nr:fimbria/pilus outer membrane usher protein [Buttiauxella sp. A2-C1_F]MCE0844158.1 fimbria/pilus outer membrane usher protein [Buttiauxella sp. A2-C1_F]
MTAFLTPNTWQLLTAGMLIPASIVLPVALANESEKLSREEEEFSAEILKQRGIDPQLADYFSGSPRFTPGKHNVRIIVNGTDKGKLNASFNQEGQLCFDPALLAAAGLKDPLNRDPDAAQSAVASSACQAFLEAYPLTLVELRTGENEVDLVVPTQALNSAQDVSGYTTGGTAALLNYELLGVNSQYAGGSSNSYSATTELGFNAADWIVRSRQIYSSSNGNNQFQHMEAYAQRSFAEQGAVLQTGQIRLVNPVLSGAQITGFQWMNEQALSQQNMPGRVEGIAQGTARVEVSQMGSLIYTTVVPGGPFVLTDVPRISQRFDLNVKVIEADGSEHSFTVSAAVAGIASPESGYAYAIGQVRNLSGTTEKPLVASAGWSGALGPDTSISNGVMLATHYASVGSGIGHSPWEGALAQWDMVGSRANREGKQGGLTRLSLTQNLGANWNVEAAASLQSPGFRELIDVSYSPSDDDTRLHQRQQLDTRLGWSHPWLGSFSTGFSQATYSDGSMTRRATANWGISFRYVSLNLSAERDLGSSSWVEGMSKNSNSYYVSLNIPFGDRPRITTTMRESGGSRRYGINASDSVNDAFSYRVGGEQDSRDNTTSLSAGTSFIPRYMSVDLDYSGDGKKLNSFSGGMRGGVVAHANGVTASPYTVKETFGLVNVGDVSGVKLNTPSGPVWTDSKGNAVLSQLNGFGRNTVDVANNSLPRNVDIQQGFAEVRPGRGSVQRVDFHATTTRRVLMQITTATGQPLPTGALITDQNNQPVGMVERAGEMFLENATELKTLWVTGAGIQRCRVDITLPKQADELNYYETVPAVCRAN